MERFATPVPCIYSDGDQDQVKGQLGIYTALTFKRFQQLMTQKTGVPSPQLSAVLAYKRSVNGEEKRQKLNINESTNFGIVMRIHAKETDAHFVISLKRSKRDRKGASWRKAADVEDENDVRSEGIVAVDASGVEKAGGDRKEAEWEEAERKGSERNEPTREEARRDATDFDRQRERDVQKERFGVNAAKGTVEQFETDRNVQTERRHLQPKTGQDEPLSPVSTLPAVPGFFPPSPVSPDQEPAELLKLPHTRLPVADQMPRETPSSNKAAQRPEPVYTGSVKSSSEPSRPSFHERTGGVPKSFSEFKPVTILRRPSVPTSKEDSASAGNRSPQVSTASEAVPGRRPRDFSHSEASFSGRPQVFLTPGARPETLKRTEDPSLSVGSQPFLSSRFSQVQQQAPQQQEREAFLRSGQGARLFDGAASSSGRFQQMATPVESQVRFPAFPDPSDRPASSYSHHSGQQFGQQFGFQDRPNRGPIMGRHVATQPPLDTRPSAPRPTAPGSQSVSASVFASAVSAATEALAPGRHPDARAQAARHVSGRETGHVALGGSSVGVPGQTRELTPLEMAGLHGVLRDLAAASGGRREGFAGFAKTCKFCAFCVERQRGPTPFHWCVDDRVVSGFRGPSPAGPIERPGKRIEAAA